MWGKWLIGAEVIRIKYRGETLLSDADILIWDMATNHGWGVTPVT